MAKPTPLPLGRANPHIMQSRGAEPSIMNFYCTSYSTGFTKPNITNKRGKTKDIPAFSGGEVFIPRSAPQLKKTGFISEGDVYTTKSGEMGVKINSIIIHAVGPVWKGGLSSEAKTLSGLVKKCLIESNKNNCNSIVIPPISTGLFNYPVEDAVEVISKTVLEYVYENPSTTLSKIIFISNEETVVKSWELVLLYIANIYNIKIEKRAQKVQISNDRWLWKDDEGKWLFLINNIKFNKLILRKLESICI